MPVESDKVFSDSLLPNTGGAKIIPQRGKIIVTPGELRLFPSGVK
jgi:hypothetical protein